MTLVGVGSARYPEGMLTALRRLVLPVLLGLGLLAVLTVGAAVLVLYREAAAAHPLLGVAVVAVALLGVGLLVVWPVATVLAMPRALRAPDPGDSRAWSRYVRRYAARLARNPLLAAEWDEHGTLVAALRQRDGSVEVLVERVEAAVARLDGIARARIQEHAARVFAMTAVSQSGRLDTIVVIGAQLRLVRDVARVYVQRPSSAELLRLYANVGASAFVAGEIEDSEILAVLGAPVSAALTSLVPLQGTDPLISMLVSSLMDGSANGFLTLRVGAIARRYCGLRPDSHRRAVATSASLEAAGLLGGAVTDGARRVARATRRLVVQSAVEGTGKAARSVAGAGSAAAGRVAGLVDRTAREIGRRAQRPPRRVLEEALRFWEGIAGRH